MLTETEAVENIQTILEINQGRTLKKLIYVLIESHPELLVKLESQNQKLFHVYNEYFDLTVILLDKLIVVIEQTTWVIKENAILSSVWIIEYAKSLLSLDGYIETITKSIIDTFKPNSTIHLNPECSIILYHQVKVLKRLIQEVDGVKETLRSQFYEEFLYYLTVSSINNKDMTCDPIREIILKTLEHIIKEITQRPFSLQTTKQSINLSDSSS
ncbi:DgyrCDS618 [Dimorphilus gyrociliatus]|uniref:DgyrCDS618 n=1 Tax=Dimorphilus gyrociliatus TaxID=2664684 RepID=A0A7I8V586_9ANNE|nr:DgyrCDS618 [Dimorphilus gyrociliatus]